MPKRDSCVLGDVVILQSGDILVWVGDMWDLLPGRYLDINELKDFILYIRSGWPNDTEMMLEDLKGLINTDFLTRMEKTVKTLIYQATVLTSTATS
jgi:hypothetical protein